MRDRVLPGDGSSVCEGGADVMREVCVNNGEYSDVCWDAAYRG